MAQIGILKIKKLVDAMLQYIIDDYEAHSLNTEESFIERCFDSDDYDGDVIYSDVAKSLFLRDVSNYRKLETRLMYDLDRATLPTIHVREPAKNSGQYDSIGNIDEFLYINDDDSAHQARRRNLVSDFELMITSGNRHEVIVIEEVIYGLLLSLQDTIALNMPYMTIQTSVKELMASSDGVPQPLFIKSITLKLSYDKTYPDITEITPLLSIIFNKTLLNS